MKQIISIVLLIISFSGFSQKFEGKLIYKVTFSGTVELMDSSYYFNQLLKSRSGYYNTVEITIKDSNFSQKVNYNYGSKEEITLMNERLKFSLKKNKIKICDLSIAEPLLKVDSNEKFGIYISHSSSDTLITIDSVIFNAQKITVVNKYATETYIISEELHPLVHPINLINSAEYQLYPKPLDSLIGKRILLAYSVTNIQMKGNNSKAVFELISLKETPIEKSKFILPKYRNTIKTRKDNKYSYRCKEYKTKKF